MAETITAGRYQIERLVTTQSWRGTPSATFNWLRKPGEAWVMCDVWFEDGKPNMQVRSSAEDLEMAHAISVVLQMAIEWATGVIAEGKHLLGPVEEAPCAT